MSDLMHQLDCTFFGETEVASQIKQGPDPAGLEELKDRRVGCQEIRKRVRFTSLYSLHGIAGVNSDPFVHLLPVCPLLDESGE